LTCLCCVSLRHGYADCCCVVWDVCVQVRGQVLSVTSDLLSFANFPKLGSSSITLYDTNQLYHLYAFVATQLSRRGSQLKADSQTVWYVLAQLLQCCLMVCMIAPKPFTFPSVSVSCFVPFNMLVVQQACVWSVGALLLCIHKNL
jgi:hypothetical protein